MPSLAVAAGLHILVLYGLGFTVEDLKPPARTMEVTLATFPSDDVPDKADYLAQSNQQGSGTLDKKALPSTDSVAPFQSKTPQQVQLEQQAPVLSVSEKAESKTVTSVASSSFKSPVASENSKVNPVGTKQPPRARIDLSKEIASLEADFRDKRQAYAKKPVIHRINAVSTRASDKFYQEAWRRTVIRIGTLNYPAQARKDKIYGELRVAVQIRRDGSLRNVEVLRSSGYKILDDAARRIVRMAAPFAPFPQELQKYDVIEIIRTWRFEPGDRFSG